MVQTHLFGLLCAFPPIYASVYSSLEHYSLSFPTDYILVILENPI